MKMTAEEIVKSFKEDSSRENMQRLADENECSLHDIGEFLKEEAAKNTPAADKKKAGWPKGKKRGPKPQKVSEKETTLNNTNEKVEIKVESREAEMRDEKEFKKDIPEAVKRILITRLNILNEKQKVHIEALDEISAEREEIARFLWG